MSSFVISACFSDGLQTETIRVDIDEEFSRPELAGPKVSGPKVSVPEVSARRRSHPEVESQRDCDKRVGHADSSLVINTCFSDGLQTETIRLEIDEEFPGPKVSGPEVSVPRRSRPEVDSRRDCDRRVGHADSAPLVEEFSHLMLVMLFILLCINVYLMTLTSRIPEGRRPRFYVPPVHSFDDYLKFSYRI